MSVIFGIVEKTRIIVAGDKRATSQDGELISDDMEKVIIINKRVCLATAGNASIAKAIMKRVEGEYSCAVKPHVRSDGNRQSGTRKPLGASLLA